MRYVSTRGGGAPQSFTDVVLGGLAEDGGLTTPEQYPRLSPGELAALRPLGYRELAFEIIRRFVDDIRDADLRALIDRTYTRQVFGGDEITPVKTLEPQLHLLGLSNGPTLAFKDIAMQLLGNLFEYVLAQRGESLNILGATSGDTGSAAEYAMRGKQGIRVFMLSPEARMSAFQRAQMFSLMDANIFNLAVCGVFDDCQDIVKRASEDLAFKARYRIGTVNSINWARLLAQVVYYFKGYFAVTRSNAEQVSFAVPTGNFGNVCAGHVARMMGLPIRRLIVATNENDVLEEFFVDGVYRPRPTKEVFETSSPSMDISRASNFERFIYDLTLHNHLAVRELWTALASDGYFDISATACFERIPEFGFVAGSSTHADRLATIRRVWRDYGVMIDPHTADGVKVGREFAESGVPLVCLETALPAKFEATMREALEVVPPRPAAYADLESRPQRCEVIDANVDAVKAFIASRCPS